MRKGNRWMIPGGVCAGLLLVMLGHHMEDVNALRAARHEQLEERADQITSRLEEDILSGLSETDGKEEDGSEAADRPHEAETDEDETGESSESDEENGSVPGNHRVIFVGDSRTVGMARAEKKTGDTCIYIGQSGEGLDWFLDQGVTALEEAIEAEPDVPVVYNLGVNDCYDIDDYILVYRDIEDAHPDTRFYYMSVNPVTEESPVVHNREIRAFNRKLRAAFPEQYINSFSLMMTQGFDCVDGIHYTGEQYRVIHDYAVSVVSKQSQ